MNYGYARCSTDEKLGLQDIQRQVLELEKQGIERKNIYLEYASRN